jgi:hypothetical protein
LPPPSISGISPTGGSLTGGTEVTITGDNLTEVKSVAFGTTQANFTLVSESKLTAVTPPGPALTTVPVSVETAAGHAQVSRLYTYEACVVPGLKEMSLATAKKVLKAGNCSLGQVRKSRRSAARARRVVRQRPTAQTLLPPGRAVDVVLGRRVQHSHRRQPHSTIEE